MHRRGLYAFVVCGFVATAALGDPPKKFQFVDIQAQINARFTERKELQKLPQGELTFAAIPFRVHEGMIQIAGKREEQRSGDPPANEPATKAPAHFGKIVENKPERITGIKINSRCTRLHLLNSACLYTPMLRNGCVIGWYTIHYDDDSISAIPLIYHSEIIDIQGLSSAIAFGRPGIAWQGMAEELPPGTYGNRLIVGSWQNPNPAKKIATIDFSGGILPHAAPFCVAITAETGEVAASDTLPDAIRRQSYHDSFRARDLNQLAYEGTRAAKIDAAGAIAQFAAVPEMIALQALGPFWSSSDVAVQLALVTGIEKRAAAQGHPSSYVVDLGSTPDKPGNSAVLDPAGVNGPWRLDPAGGVKMKLLQLSRSGADGQIRDAALSAWKRMEFPAELSSLHVARLAGQPLIEHPSAKFKVAGGSLLDGDGHPVLRLIDDQEESLSSWSFSPDSRWLAIGIRHEEQFSGSKTKGGGTLSGRIRLYDLNAKSQIAFLRTFENQPLGPIEAVSFSENGQTLQFQTGRYKFVIDGK